MDVAQFFAFVVINCSVFLLVVDGEAPIMSKKYIRNNDSFTMTCNASSFFNPNIYYWYNIKSYKLYRKLDSGGKEEPIGMIEVLNPKSVNPIIQQIPQGRKWEYSYGGLYGYNMYITLKVYDASKADVGYYWCEAEIYGMTDTMYSYLFNLRPLGEEPVQIIDKKEIGNKDNFTLTCNNTSFRDSNLPRYKYITRILMLRQLDGSKEEEYLGMLESFIPAGADYGHIAKNIPDGRQWEFTAGGFDGDNNKQSIFFTLTVKDATCKDAGYYWCAMHVPRTSFRFYSPKFQLKPKASKVVKMNAIKVTPTQSASFNTSYNFVDDYVTMECIFTGWNPMITSWSYKTLYNQHNYNAKLFEAEPFIDVDGCPAYTHRSTKTAVLHRMIGDYIYFCRALNERGADTRVFASMQFILLEKESALSKSQATHFEMSSALLLVWCVCWRFYTIVYCDSVSMLVFYVTIFI